MTISRTLSQRYVFRIISYKTSKFSYGIKVSISGEGGGNQSSRGSTKNSADSTKQQPPTPKFSSKYHVLKLRLDPPSIMQKYYFFNTNFYFPSLTTSFPRFQNARFQLKYVLLKNKEKILK